MKTKDQIIQHGIELFSKHGYEGTSMSLIAGRIGVKKPSLYSHYANKLALFEACLDEIIHKQFEITQRILLEHEKESVERRLYLLLTTCSAEVGTEYYSFYYRFLFYPPQEIENLTKTKFTDSISKTLILVTEVIALGIKNGELSSEFSFNEAVQGYTFLLDGLACNPENQKNVEAIWRTFWNGLRG